MKKNDIALARRLTPAETVIWSTICGQALFSGQLPQEAMALAGAAVAGLRAAVSAKAFSLEDGESEAMAREAFCLPKKD